MRYLYGTMFVVAFIWFGASTGDRNYTGSAITGALMIGLGILLELEQRRARKIAAARLILAIAEREKADK